MSTTLDTLDTLRFTTAGSVDDGKSTLIGRLLYDAKSIFEDQLASIAATTEKRGGGRVDLSLLTDGLTAEREQGITIDVAYRYFTSERRRFIIADTPGHEQYTRNMVTGASTADLTVVLVDAAKGLSTQSRRHAVIASLLGIPHVVLAVNKMDAVGYSQTVFERIRAEFLAFCRDLDLAEIDAIPVSALEGDMVVERGQNLAWYAGPTLLELLETSRAAEAAAREFRFPVQRVAQTRFGDLRGYQGRIESGRVSVGDAVAVLPSGLTAKVAGIVTLDGNLATATAPASVTLLLDTQLDVSRGDLIAHADALPTVTNSVAANLAWMATAPLDAGRRYLVKHTTQTVRTTVTAIDHRLDVNTLARETGVTTFRLNDIGRVQLKTQKPLIVDSYRANRATGSFILIDEVTHQTVAAGMIQGAVDG